MSLSAGAVAFMKDMNKQLKYELLVSADQLAVPRRFTTGSPSIDVALGGGLPGNQWCEVVGQSQVGKTFLAHKAVAANQKADPGFTTLWVSAEPYNVDWADALGVDNNRVVAVPTSQMETALEVLIKATTSKEFDGIVLDSLPALLPDEEAEKAMDEFTTALGARLMGKFVRKATDASRRKYDGTERPFFGIIINQWRDKIGGFSRFGTPQTTPGGNGKDYFYYCRLDITRKEWITEKRPGIEKPVVVGQVDRVKTIKNKSAAPQQSVEVPLYVRRASNGMQRGDLDLGFELFEMAKLLHILTRRGSYYGYGGQEWNGQETVKAAIREDAGLQQSLYAEVMKAAADPRSLDLVE